MQRGVKSSWSNKDWNCDGMSGTVKTTEIEGGLYWYLTEIGASVVSTIELLQSAVQITRNVQVTCRIEELSLSPGDSSSTSKPKLTL